MTKQEKGAQTTALRTAARRTKIAFAVMVLVDRNRTKQWKWIYMEAGRLCGTSSGAVAKMLEASAAFRLMKKLLADPRTKDVPIIDPGLDLDAYIKDRDLTEPLKDAMAGEGMDRAMALLHSLPGMGRGRPPHL